MQINVSEQDQNFSIKSAKEHAYFDNILYGAKFFLPCFMPLLFFFSFSQSTVLAAGSPVDSNNEDKRAHPVLMAPH